jgi:hypothetical protein
MENVSVGTQSLHESLGGTIAQKFRDGTLFGNLLPKVEEFVLILRRVIEVGVINKGRKVVFLTPEPEALKVDDPCFSLVEDKVLGLKVSMDKVAVRSTQISAKPGEFFVVSESCAVEAKMPLDKIIDEVVLLPCVGLGAEWGREFEVSR